MKKVYHSCLLLLCKQLSNDLISVEQFKDSLKLLCNSYRKEIKNYGS